MVRGYGVGCVGDGAQPLKKTKIISWNVNLIFDMSKCDDWEAQGPAQKNTTSAEMLFVSFSSSFTLPVFFCIRNRPTVLLLNLKRKTQVLWDHVITTIRRLAKQRWCVFIFSLHTSRHTPCLTALRPRLRSVHAVHDSNDLYNFFRLRFFWLFHSACRQQEQL